jgi:hypothetical protein
MASGTRSARRKNKRPARAEGDWPLACRRVTLLAFLFAYFRGASAVASLELAETAPGTALVLLVLISRVR